MLDSFSNHVIWLHLGSFWFRNSFWFMLDSFSNHVIWLHLGYPGLCIDYPVERCKITVILFGMFGSMFVSYIAETHPGEVLSV